MPKLRCPICQAPVDPRTSPAMPFCSVRCRRLDLNRWLDEDYGLPIEPDEDQPGGGELDEERPDE